MLYNLEPDRSLTGGAWYSDQDFESDFVDALNQGCYRILKQKRDTAKKLAGGPLAVNNHAYASVTDVCKYINELGLSKVSWVLFSGYRFNEWELVEPSITDH